MVSIFTTILFSLDWQDNEKIWSKVFIDQNTFGTGNPNYKLDAPASQTKTFLFGGSGVTVNPNFRPFPTTNPTQSELSVDVALFSEQIIFASVNATPCPVGFPLNPNRADGAIDVPITLAQLSWDNDVGSTEN